MLEVSYVRHLDNQYTIGPQNPVAFTDKCVDIEYMFKDGDRRDRIHGSVGKRKGFIKIGDKELTNLVQPAGGNTPVPRRFKPLVGDVDTINLGVISHCQGGKPAVSTSQIQKTLAGFQAGHGSFKTVFRIPAQ